MEIGVRIVGVILKILHFLLSPFFWLASRGKRGTVPATRDPILFYGVQELAKKIRNGEVTSEKVVTTYIERIKEVNPYLNAVVEDRFRAAFEESKNADKILEGVRSSGDWKSLEEKPLIGVPFTVKESCVIGGMSNSVGSLSRAHSKAATDSPVVKHYKDAGGIPLLVSNTPELCLGWETNNLLRGATNNPYCFARTPGGSSGGEAALISSAASPFGIVSDIAGSIRIPAAFCGVFGHKPTPGIVPIDGHIPSINDVNFPKYLCVGPMCREAADLDFLLKIMAGPQVERLNLDKPVNLDELNVFYMTEATHSSALQSTESSIKTAIKNAAHYLEGLGSTVQDKKFLELDDSVELSISVFFSMKEIENIMENTADPKKPRSLSNELLHLLLGNGTRSLQSIGFSFIHRTKLFIPNSRTAHYHAKAQTLRQEMMEALGDNGVFLYPVFNGVAHRHNEIYTKASGVVYTMIFNLFGMPATVVPMGLYNGLPVAIQVVAAPNQDRLCLAVARQLEAGFGGWKAPF